MQTETEIAMTHLNSPGGNGGGLEPRLGHGRRPRALGAGGPGDGEWRRRRSARPHDGQDAPMRHQHTPECHREMRTLPRVHS
jgi:hypothetical protein